MAIKNIIFDLGRVIIDLDFNRMKEEFERLGIKDFSNYYNLQKQNSLFEDFELGKISKEEFYEKLRKDSGSQLTNEQIEKTWDSMLEPFVPERMALLEVLAQDYKIFLFSNTNATHAEFFEARCIEQTGKTLSSYFIELFYSHELHLRKPEVEAFQEVIQLAKVNPAETLFIDDNADNIKGAHEAGLHAYHLVAPETIVDLDFKKLGQ